MQEVIACKNATLNYASNIDVVVELGGEDANKFKVLTKAFLKVSK